MGFWPKKWIFGPEIRFSVPKNPERQAKPLFFAPALCKILSEGSKNDPSDRVLQRARAEKSGLACLQALSRAYPYAPE